MNISEDKKEKMQTFSQCGDAFKYRLKMQDYKKETLHF